MRRSSAGGRSFTAWAVWGRPAPLSEYTLEHADDYRALLFVTADSPESLERNLAALCSPLVLNLPEQEARETELQVSAVRRWLNRNPGLVPDHRQRGHV